MNMCALSIAQQSDWLTRKIFGASAASPLARESDAIFMWIFWFSTFWFVLLMGLMAYWVIKYRRRPGVAPERSAHHNTPLELAWTIIPSLFLGYMFYVGFQGYISNLVAPTNAEIIDVQGRKWVWTITYPNGANPLTSVVMGNNQAAPEIYIPVGRPVQFRMTSVDVMHSFWIPDFRFKQDILPNRYSSFWIEAEEPGDHVVYCAEYCGDLHSEMSAIIRAIPADEYDAYLKSIEDPGGPPAVRGKRIVDTRGGCVACHSIDGTKGIGPTWKDAWGFPVQFADGTSLPGDDPDAWDNYIRESIINPNARIHSGYAAAMASYAGAFTEAELGYIVEYIKSLSSKAPAGEIPTEEDPAEAPAD